MASFVMSDPHIDHKNIIKYADRPFQSTEEMNEIIIKNINDKVKISDTLYIIGDLGATYSFSPKEFFSRLNCRWIHLIMGNHDNSEWLKEALFLKNGIYYQDGEYGRIYVHNYLEKLHYSDTEDKFSKHRKREKIVMFHYPILHWADKHKGAIHLYGHLHKNHFENIPEELMKNAYNVNLEFWDYKPIPLDYFLKVYDKNANGIRRKGNE